MASAAGIRSGRAYVEVGVLDKVTAGLRAIQGKLNAFASSVQSTGRGLALTGAAGAVPFIESLRSFAEFEKRMSRVKALTGASGATFEALNETAKRLGATTVFTAGQAAEGMSFLAMAGFGPEQILKSIGPSLELAAAGQLELGRAADIVTNIMTGMGVAAKDVGAAVDVVTRAATQANTNVEQLGEAMSYVAPLARMAGMSIEETSAGIQVLSNAGIQGSMAGTALRGVLVALTAPTDVAREKMRELGVSIGDAAGNVLPLADIVRQFERVLRGMGSERRLEALGAIFDTRQITGMTTLINTGSATLRRFTDNLQAAGGTANRIAKTQLDNLAGSVVLVLSVLEGLKNAVGDSIQGPLRALGGTIIDVTAAATSWVKENRDVVAMVAATVTAIVGAGMALIGIGLTIKGAAFALSAASAPLLLVNGALAAMMTTTGLVVGGLVAIAVNLDGAGRAAGAAADWIMAKFDRLRAFMRGVLKGVGDALKAGDVKLASEILWKGLEAAWRTGTNKLNEVIETWKAFSVNVFTDFWARTLRVDENAWNAMKILWIESTNAMSKILIGFWNRTIAGASSAIGEITGAIASLKKGGKVDILGAGIRVTQSILEGTTEGKELQKSLDQDLKDRLKEQKTEHDKRLKEINKWRDEQEGETQGDALDDITESQNKLDDAKKELNRLLTRARKGPATLTQGAFLGVPISLPVGLARAMDSIVKSMREKAEEALRTNIGEPIEKAMGGAARVETFGTFSVAGLTGLGDRPLRAQERTAYAAERSANALERIERRKENKLKFGA